MYLPAYKSIAASFSVNSDLMNLSMSTYLLGIAFGQILYGPLSDRFGRKKVLLPGLVIFCIASFGCAFATNFSLFLICRLLQAIGASSASVLCRAIVADSYLAKKRTQVLALISATNIFSPALAPLYGGFITLYFNWRMIFIFIACFSIVMFICTKLIIKETLKIPNINALKFSTLKVNLVRILQNRVVAGYILILSMLYLITFSWIMLSPSLLIHYFKITQDAFGYYFMLPAFGSCLGAFIVAKYSPQFNPQKSIITGIIMILVATLCFSISKDFIITPVILIIFVTVICFGNGFTTPQLVSETIGQFLDISGLASSVIGFTQTISGSILGIVASYYYNSSINVIDILFVLPAIVSLLAFFVANNQNRAYEKQRFWLRF